MIHRIVQGNKAFSNRKDKPKQRDINLFSDLLGYDKLRRKENKQSTLLEIQNKLAFIQTGQLVSQLSENLH